MRKKFKNFINWCNANQGFLTFLALLVALYTIIPYNKIDFSSANSFLNNVLTFILYPVKVPMYILFIAGLVISLYVLNIIRKYRRQPITAKFLVGTWRNEWSGDGFDGTQVFQITKDGNYILAGKPSFRIQDFEYDPSKAQIKFTKVGLLATDERILINTLKLVNNDLLEGTEDFYNIKYTRLTN